MTAAIKAEVIALALALVAGAASVRAETPSPSILRGTRGTALGYGSGLRGREFAQDLQVRVPVWQYAGLDLRMLAIHDGYRGPHRFDLGARLGMFACTAVQAELARGYASAGIHMIAATTGVEDPRPTFGGGGEVGVELFALLNRFSFYLEVGGASGDRLGFGRGVSAMAGVRAYPF